MPTFDAMELIWNSLENKEGDSVRFVREDIATLWDYGFVDTKKYSKESWIDIFDSYKQPDGTYRFTQEEFATLEKYRYQGPIKIPFDPTLINEGKYTEEGFWELVDLSIAPSCSLAKRELQKNVEELKKKFKQGDGLLLIKMPVKLEIRQWIDEHPSPTRRREILFDKLLEQQAFRSKSEKAAQKASKVATPDQQAQIQVSTFSMIPTSLAEKGAKEFKKMAKAKPSESQSADKNSTELKSVKRNRKGLLG